MKVEPLSIDIVGLVGACSYALDCIEAELVNVKNKHGKRVAYISVRMAEYWSIKSDALQDLAMCALLHDNALTQYISEELQNHSDVSIAQGSTPAASHTFMFTAVPRQEPVVISAYNLSSESLITPSAALFSSEAHASPLKSVKYSL